MLEFAYNSSKTRRIIFGVAILFAVNVLWVASSEISRWLFNDQHYSNAYVTTYLKTCLFMVYLLGFVFHRSWRDQCLKKQVEPADQFSTGIQLKLLSDQDDEDSNENLDEHNKELSPPIYELVRRNSDSSDKSSLTSLCNELNDDNADRQTKRARLVRFKKVKEVRKMPQLDAEAALLARLSHDAWIRMTRLITTQYHYKLPIRKVAQLAFQFTFVWFLGNYAFHEALKYTEAGVVSILSSTSSFFTVLLAGCLPSGPNDKLTVSKICLVLVSLFGVCTVTYADKGSLEEGIPKGAIWALVGSMSYSVYLVFLRRSVESEDQIDIPMFFGFVGLFNAVFMWPGMYLLHVSNLEPFYPLPEKTQLLYMIINGFLGTVLSEYLWLCGCFLTNSLTATLSLSVSIPLTIIVDCVLRRTNYSFIFYVGSVPILLSVLLSSLLLHYDNYDPVCLVLQALFYKICLFLRVGTGLSFCHMPTWWIKNKAKNVSTRNIGNRTVNVSADQEESEFLIEQS